MSNPNLVNVMPDLKHSWMIGTVGVRTELRNTNLIIAGKAAPLFTKDKLTHDISELKLGYQEKKTSRMSGENRWLEDSNCLLWMSHTGVHCFRRRLQTPASTISLQILLPTQ